MNIGNSQFLSIEQLQDQYLKQQKTAPSSKPTQGISFEEILHKQQAQEIEAKELKFSKHASNRLNDRNIELTREQVERLNMGAAKASAKGINESLVIVDSLAFIVNVPNQTVITAMDQTETSANVFTNIDGAVIM